MPEPLLYLTATGTSAIGSAVFVLAMLAVRRQAGTTWLNTACALGIGLGLLLGCSSLSLQLSWPPRNGLDRLMTIVLPAALGIELIAGFERVPPRIGWFLRLCLAAAVPRVLLHGSVYLSGADDWSLWQAGAAMAVCGALLAGLWGMLSWLSLRSPGVSLPLALCLATQCAGLTVMMAGYIKGGTLAFPLVGTLVATTVGVRFSTTRIRPPRSFVAPTILGIGVVGLFGLLFIGRFFGRLSTSCALAILLAPLLCWMSEAPLLRHRRPWLVGTLRLALVAIPLMVVLALAKRDFDRNMAPLLGQVRPSCAIARDLVGCVVEGRVMLHRRDAMIRLGQFGAGALTLPSLLRAEKRQPGIKASGGRAKSCILIYLWGGPPQMDMWDPNPEAPSGIRSHFRPIATSTPGIHVSEAMPLFAGHTDQTAIIRSLSHDSNVHEASVYRTLTGRVDRTLRVPRNDRKRSDAPTAGSVASYFLQQRGTPGAVTVPRPIGHEGVTYSGTYAGYLGPRYDPMEISSAGEMKGPPPLALELPAGITDQRVLARRGLLESLEGVDRRFQADPPAAEVDDFREMAYGMLGSSPIKRALEINTVDDTVRDRYGRNEWGEAILTARRLVEAGVRLVTISWMYIQKSGNVANVWDNHGPFEGLTGYEMLQAEYCLPSLDRGFHALLEDLGGSGLLEETLVAMFGEFGRTPKINKNGGRDHWGACQSAVLAGGGIQGGQVHGASDHHSAYPASDAVSPEDLLATIYHALNIAPHSILYDQENRPHHAVAGKPLTGLF